MSKVAYNVCGLAIAETSTLASWSWLQPLDVPASDERWSSYPKLDKSRQICAAMTRFLS